MPEDAPPNDGSLLEQQAESMIGLRRDVTVERHRRLDGKVSDLFVEFRNGIIGTQRVVVECKDKKRPLTREAVLDIWRDYQPLVDSRKADRLLIVTRNGIVAGASSAIRELPITHRTIRNLVDDVISTENLLSYAERTFENDRLSQYYQDAEAFDCRIELASREFEFYYSEAADIFSRYDDSFATDDETYFYLERALADVPDASFGDGHPRDRLNPDMKRIVKARGKELIVPMFGLVDRWLALEAAGNPLGFAVLGSYGTGKSSFAKALAARTARRYRAGEDDRLPVLIELRHFGEHQSIEGLIAHELANRHGMTNAGFDTFRAMNEDGKFLVILDGFDEMKEGMSSSALSYNFSEINRLVRGEAKVVLCGRPTVFRDEREQRQLLSQGGGSDYFEAARYLQIKIAPMKIDRTRLAIRAYVNSRREEFDDQTDARLLELDSEIENNANLQDLLKRPVHFPMLLNVLPSWSGRFAQLTRAELYGTFVRQTIARELKPGRPSKLGLRERRKFAGDLATHMFKSGDGHTIRYGMIPDELVLRYQSDVENVDELRRELVRACFLERKQPDLLYFPHKSFGEYLVAERLVSEARRERPDTDALGVSYTPEILSFHSELASVETWHTLLSNAESNDALVRAAFSAIGSAASGGSRGRSELKSEHPALLEALTGNSAFEAMRSERGLLVAGADNTVVSAMTALEKLARTGFAFPSSGLQTLREVMIRGQEFAAIHAARALSYFYPTWWSELEQSNPGRADMWRKKQWVEK